MGSMVTGDMYTQEEYDAMSVVERADLQIVPLKPKESKMLEGMNQAAPRLDAQEQNAKQAEAQCPSHSCLSRSKR